MGSNLLCTMLQVGSLGIWALRASLDSVNIQKG
jgi:hypothetical protein